MTLVRIFLGCIALLACASSAFAQSEDAAINPPVLRPHVTVTNEVVRIGDMVDNAGSAAQIAIYRAPDLGTTGALPAEQVIATLRTHHVIGVETRDIREVMVTRASRVMPIKDIERAVAEGLERRNGLGDAANLALTFDRDVRAMQLDAASTGEPTPVAVRYDSRSQRFDVTIEIANRTGAPTRMRFTGTAVETVAIAMPVRNVDRGETLKASDVIVERRPKAEAGADLAGFERAIGMQARKPLRASQPIRNADLAKPDLVQRDQAVTLIYNMPGMYLTVRGKAVDNGTDGDTVTVTNLQSKRMVQGTVVGAGQVAVTVAPPPRVVASAATLDTVAPANITSSSPAASKAE